MPIVDGDLHAEKTCNISCETKTITYTNPEHSHYNDDNDECINADTTNTYLHTMLVKSYSEVMNYCAHKCWTIRLIFLGTSQDTI